MVMVDMQNEQEILTRSDKQSEPNLVREALDGWDDYIKRKFGKPAEDSTQTLPKVELSDKDRCPEKQPPTSGKPESQKDDIVSSPVPSDATRETKPQQEDGRTVPEARDTEPKLEPGRTVPNSQDTDSKSEPGKTVPNSRNTDSKSEPGKTVPNSQDTDSKSEPGKTVPNSRNTDSKSEPGKTVPDSRDTNSKSEPGKTVETESKGEQGTVGQASKSTSAAGATIKALAGSMGKFVQKK
jgi:hypothetical protein